jgi:hypothetical protein
LELLHPHSVNSQLAGLAVIELLMFASASFEIADYRCWTLLVRMIILAARK